MLEALEDRVTRAPVVKVVTIPIPDLGYSIRDKYASPVSKTALRYAPIMVNWMIVDGRLTVRPGYVTWAAGGTLPASENIESLLVYAPNSGTNAMYACNAGGNNNCEIYNVTGSGATGAAVVTGLSSARFVSTMYAGVAATYLVAVNDSTADPVKNLTGTTWSDAAITNVDPKTLFHVCAHKGRLWFTQAASMKAWYLSAFAIQGAATPYDMGPLCRYGGYLMACGSWSYDGGSGPDDMFVAITSEGEVLVFSGVDPNTVGEWSLVGIFKIDRPVGRRCLVKFGSDLVVYTQTGPVRLSQVLGSIAPRDTFSDQLRSDFVEAYGTAAANHGWELALYSKRGWLIVNYPLATAGSFRQFVFNPLMNSWFPFSDLPAQCWAQSGNGIYFGGKGAVYRWDSGVADDNGNAVVADLSLAWYNYGTALKKHFTLARPHFLTDGQVQPLVDMRVDYDESGAISAAVASTAPEGSIWGAADNSDGVFWDEGIWGGNVSPYAQWLTVGAEGNIGSLRLRVSTFSAILSLTGIDIGYIEGGVI